MARSDHYANFLSSRRVSELALLNSTPRAATITACAAPTEQTATEGNKLRVATLSERAFTRLLGPLAGIMQRNAATNYGPSASADVGPSPGLQTTSMEVELGPHETSATPGMGTWIGGPGASPFGGAQGRMPGAPMA